MPSLHQFLELAEFYVLRARPDARRRKAGGRTCEPRRSRP